MSAHIIYDTAPLGALIRYTDHAPEPPARFTRKLAFWESRNGVGRLVRKEPRWECRSYTIPSAFVLHDSKFADGSMISDSGWRRLSVDDDLSFEIVERPAIGMVRVLQGNGDDSLLLHLAENREAAKLWLAKNRYIAARLEDVTADEVGADVVEGRAVA